MKRLLIVLSLSFGLLLRMSTLKIAYAGQAANSFGSGFADALNDAIRARNGEQPYPPIVSGFDTNRVRYCVDDGTYKDCSIFYDLTACNRVAKERNGSCIAYILGE